MPAQRLGFGFRALLSVILIGGQPASPCLLACIVGHHREAAHDQHGSHSAPQSGDAPGMDCHTNALRDAVPLALAVGPSVTGTAPRLGFTARVISRPAPEPRTTGPTRARTPEPPPPRA